MKNWGYFCRVVGGIFCIFGIVCMLLDNSSAFLTGFLLLALGIPLVISSIITIGKGKREKQKEEEIQYFAALSKTYGILPNAIRVQYEGGHPSLPPGQVYFWSDNENLRLASVNGQAIITKQDVVSFTCNRNVQHVNVGGGRSIGGAIVGHAIAGNVGAIVGGQKTTELKKFDESRTILVIKHGNIQLQLSFVGGQETYSAMIPFVAG